MQVIRANTSKHQKRVAVIWLAVVAMVIGATIGSGYIVYRRTVISDTEYWRRDTLVRPTSDGAFTMLGLSLEAEGKDAEALVALRKATWLQPRNFSALMEIGFIDQRHGEVQDAYRCWNIVASATEANRTNMGRMWHTKALHAIKMGASQSGGTR